MSLLGMWAGSSSNKLAWAEAYHHAKYQIHPSSRLATINMGRKFVEGGSAPLLGRRSGVPSNTKSPVPRHTSIPSGILIRVAIWLQQIWAKD